MMSELPILVETVADRCTLTLNRPTKVNALTADMMLTIGTVASRGAQDRPLILRSASSKVFCAGADIGEFSAGPERLAAQEHGLLEMIGRLAETAAPIVAVASGRASGAGAILLSLADIVIAADDLVVVCPEIQFGMYPVIVEAALQSRMSSALAASLCHSGRAMDAYEARQIGLVTEVLAAADFERVSEERVDFFMARAVALGVARRSRLRTQPPHLLIERLKAVAPLMGENYADQGVRKRIASYLARLGGRS